MRSTAFTLVELMVALALLSVCAAVTYPLLISFQRGYRRQTELIDIGSNLRAAVAILAAEIRELDAGDTLGGDVLEMSPTSLTYRAMRALSFLCRLPDHAAGRIMVSAAPSYGLRGFDPAADSLLIFTERDPATPDDDGWIRANLVRLSHAACPGGAPGMALVLSGVPPSELKRVSRGAPVRSFAVVQIKLYKDRRGDRWIGVRRLPKAGSSVSAVQPFAGPIADDGFCLDLLRSRWCKHEIRRPCGASRSAGGGPVGRVAPDC